MQGCGKASSPSFHITKSQHPSCYYGYHTCKVNKIANQNEKARRRNNQDTESFMSKDKPRFGDKWPFLPWKHSFFQCSAPAPNSEPEILSTQTLALKQTTTKQASKNKTIKRAKNPGTIRTLSMLTVNVPFLTSKASLQHKTEDWTMAQRMLYASHVNLQESFPKNMGHENKQLSLKWS